MEYLGEVKFYVPWKAYRNSSGHLELYRTTKRVNDGVNDYCAEDDRVVTLATTLEEAREYLRNRSRKKKEPVYDPDHEKQLSIL